MPTNTSHTPGLDDWQHQLVIAAMLSSVSPDARRRLERFFYELIEDRTDRKATRELGALLGDVTRQTDDDLYAIQVIGELLPEAGTDVITTDLLLFAARWGELGAPTVRVSGTQAAALMLSDLTPEQLAHLRPPFRAFEILLTEPLRVGDQQIGRVAVLAWDSAFATDETGRRATNRWAIRAVGQATDLYRGRATPAQLYGAAPVVDEIPGPEGSVRPDDVETRGFGLLIRLALNVALSLTAHPPPAPKKRTGKKARSRHARPYREMDLPMRVHTDMRGHIADYLSGEVDRAYKVRWIVRGHWRNQPCGPGRMQRELIWICPYWKGPEGAPTPRAAGPSAGGS